MDNPISDALLAHPGEVGDGGTHTLSELAQAVQHPFKLEHKLPLPVTSRAD